MGATNAKTMEQVYNNDTVATLSDRTVFTEERKRQFEQSERLVKFITNDSILTDAKLDAYHKLVQNGNSCPTLRFQRNVLWVRISKSDGCAGFMHTILRTNFIYYVYVETSDLTLSEIFGSFEYPHVSDLFCVQTRIKEDFSIGESFPNLRRLQFDNTRYTNCPNFWRKLVPPGKRLDVLSFADRDRSHHFVHNVLPNLTGHIGSLVLPHRTRDEYLAIIQNINPLSIKKFGLEDEFTEDTLNIKRVQELVTHFACVHKLARKDTDRQIGGVFVDAHWRKQLTTMISEFKQKHFT